MITLVKRQIQDCNVPIRAVLLVGGFGASNYLKERLRNAVDKNIQILQPPNAWLAVVQGAVMKGLALSAPNQLTAVRVQNRKARKHYGIEWRVAYNASVHSSLADKVTWCYFDGCQKVMVMNWFIRRGDAVSENEPFYTDFNWSQQVASGRIRKVNMIVYSDRTDRKAPLSKDGSVLVLCNLEADLSHIPENQLQRRRGTDGQMWYDISCRIEAICKPCPSLILAA